MAKSARSTVKPLLMVIAASARPKERKKGEKKANDEAYKAMIKRTLRP